VSAQTVHERAASAAGPHWECPCGEDDAKRGGAAPVRTMVSLREPRCTFCGTPYRDEYRRPRATPTPRPATAAAEQTNLTNLTLDLDRAVPRRRLA
jgi:hypothetical protein